MLFNSYQFLLIFFPVVTAVYYALPHRFRWLHLLVASCAFYMAFIPEYILILAFTILVDYAAAILIESSQGRARRLLMGASVLANVGVLAVFKYGGFATDNLSALLGVFGLDWAVPHLDIILPIGLSFHTFQSLSYTLEVYRGRQAAERDLGILALYVMFYPQLVAGPIERPQNLLHQLRAEHHVQYHQVASGLKLMVWGLFKKMVVADRLALAADVVFSAPGDFSGPHCAAAAVCFSYQIYCDFSGYSDIARGAARVMGIDLMVNFDRPYAAQSVAEFWRRWHISLSTWFKDYLYVPLGGSKVSAARWCFNIMVVFTVSGLWHGAKWTFIVWGALHGLFMLCGRAWQAVRGSSTAGKGPAEILVWWRRAFVFSLTSVAWVFFRADSVHDALTIIRHLPEGWLQVASLGPAGAAAVLGRLGISSAAFCGMILAVVMIEVFSPVDAEDRADVLSPRRPAALRWSLYTALVLAILNGGAVQDVPFIYFQF